MERIGFIGLGLMGAGIAANIQANGYSLSVLAHKNRDSVERLVAKGAVEVQSPKELAQTCDVVFLCVTGAPQIKVLVEGENGLCSGLHDGLIIVDCSTSDPSLTRRLHETLKKDNVTFIDAALGGTPNQAVAGELQAIVGADSQTLARLQPVLKSWANKVIHVGPVGAGHTMKLLNNFLAMGFGAIFSEALTIGAKSGISPHVFDSVIRGSRMESGFYRTFFQYVLERDRDAHRFTLNNAYKDTRYLAMLADNLNVEAGVAKSVMDLYASATAEGEGESFVPQLSDIVARRHGVSLS